MATHRVAVERIGTALSPAYRAQVEDIYEQVFPPEERRPLDEFVGAENAALWLAAHEETVLGFAMVARLGGTRTALLQYIGVRPDRQSGGVGRALLEAMSRDLADDGLQAVVLEIEDPDQPEADPQTTRRLDFYRRWGAERLTCLSGYFMPDLTVPGNRLPMVLLWRPLRDTAQPSGEALKSLLKAIFENEYEAVDDGSHLDALLELVTC